MDRIRKFNRNLSGRDFVCGDIHGCYDKLMTGLEKIHFNKTVDRLFCCGDLVDRGHDSVKCMSLVYEDWFFSVRGNHEIMMHDGLYGQNENDHTLWIQNGGLWVYEEDPNTVKLIVDDVLTKMPYAIEVQTLDGNIGIIHAEVPYNDWAALSDDRFNEERCVWARTRIKSKDTSHVKNIDRVYVGHTIVRNPIALGNVHYVDTGAFLEDGMLSIVEL